MSTKDKPKFTPELTAALEAVDASWRVVVEADFPADGDRPAATQSRTIPVEVGAVGTRLDAGRMLAAVAYASGATAVRLIQHMPDPRPVSDLMQTEAARREALERTRGENVVDLASVRPRGHA